MIKWKLWLILSVTCLIAFLGACSATTTNDEPTASVEPVYQPEPDEPAAGEAMDTKESAASAASDTVDDVESKATSDATDAVLIYERTGGLKSIRSTEFSWQFYADGRIVGNDGREWQVPPAEVEKLVDDVLALGFAEFDASYIPADTCCDRVTHTLTVQKDGQVYKVSVLDAAEAPAELFAAVEMVNNYLLALPTE